MHFNDLPEVERRAIALLLEGDGDKMGLLRKQVDLIHSVERTESGAGVYAVFTLDKGVERLQEKDSFHLANVSAVSETCAEIEFILFIKDGLIEYLEAYVYADVYPSYEGCDFRLQRASSV